MGKRSSFSSVGKSPDKVVVLFGLFCFVCLFVLFLNNMPVIFVSCFAKGNCGLRMTLNFVSLSGFGYYNVH